jgi:hypothetical protein
LKRRGLSNIFYLDDKSGGFKPVVSNESLAQCFGEALVTWVANRELMGQESDFIPISLSSLFANDHLLYSVFLIAATNTFVRFMHFRFGSHYAELISTITAEDQEALIMDSEKDSYVHVRVSEWFNLQSSRGRRTALCHVLALLRWHDAHNSTSKLGRTSESDTSMDESDSG